MKKSLFIFSFLIIAWTPAPPLVDESPDYLTIATFNIAWLGDGQKDMFSRSSDDIYNIATVIRDCGAEIIALQEIENERALERIMSFLPDWDFVILKNGSKQNLAFIFREYIKITNAELNKNMRVDKTRSRPPFMANVKAGNFDFILTTLHFKATSRYDDTEEKVKRSYKIRKAQAEMLNDWTEDFLDSSKERDLIILGDFNDNPNNKRGLLNSLVENKEIDFVTSEVPSCRNKNWKSIDHILLSKSAQKRMLKNSQRVYDFNFTFNKKDSKRISDHCPVLATFSLKSLDND
jgi:endonuclease/exonuclease/phosphatase family metal-dependent hydrolase